MRKHKLLFVGLCFSIAALCSSCKGVKIHHGKDCGCGSFGQVELKHDRPQ